MGGLEGQFPSPHKSKLSSELSEGNLYFLLCYLITRLHFKSIFVFNCNLILNAYYLLVSLEYCWILIEPKETKRLKKIDLQTCGYSRVMPSPGGTAE